MELYYNLIKVFSPKNEEIEKANDELNVFIDDNYLDESDVIEVARNNNVCIVVEVEQDDGYSETIVVDNKGEVQERIYMSVDYMDEVRNKISEVGYLQYFDEKQLNHVKQFCEEDELTIEEFFESSLDGFLLDEYEYKKNSLGYRIKEYYHK